jgi:arylsulfatase A-like enzyme
MTLTSSISTDSTNGKVGQLETPNQRSMATERSFLFGSRRVFTFAMLAGILIFLMGSLSVSMQSQQYIEALYSGLSAVASLNNSTTLKSVEELTYVAQQHSPGLTGRTLPEHPHETRIRQAIHSHYPHFEHHSVRGKVVDVTQNVNRIEELSLTRKKNVTYMEVKDEDHGPLNVVLFYADDWTLKVLGALNPHVKTPNIDQMAKNGMLFPYNCVTTSICWISRATLVTGVYAAVHQQLKIAHNSLFNNLTIPWTETLFPQLKKHGYYTGLVGKWHAPSPGKEMKLAFDVMNIYYGRHWELRNGQRRHVTDLNGEDALNFLRSRPKDQKFALKVSFFATHAQDYTIPAYSPMNESMSLYEDDDIPWVQTNTEQHWKDLPWFFDNRNEGRRRYIGRFDTPDNYQYNIKCLYRMATEVDSVVGEVIDELKRQGVYDKTLLIFTTDNGNLHGEHGLAEKWYPWEESIRVPLVIQDPRMPATERGKVNDEFTLSVDLAPTILSAAKIPIPSHMQGRDIAELYFDPHQATVSWRKDFFYEWSQGEPVEAVGHNEYYHIPAVFALIRKDWKYFYWPQVKVEQLFQIENDPYEQRDVLNSTAQTTQEALDFMRARYFFLKNYSQMGNPV